MVKRGMRCLAGLFVVAGTLALYEEAGVYGHPPVSVRPPVPAHGAVPARPAVPAHPATPAVSATHPGTVGGAHPPGRDGDLTPYNGAPAHIGPNVRYPVADATVINRNTNIGTVRSPAPATPATPAAPAARNNLGTVASPATTRTPYGTSYASTLPAGYRTLAVGGATYYYAGSHFYQPVYSGGSVVYAPTPASQMTFTGDPTLPTAPVPQQTPEEWTVASLNTAKALLKDSDNPDNKIVAKQILGTAARTYPQTKAAGEARSLLDTLR